MGKRSAVLALLGLLVAMLLWQREAFLGWLSPEAMQAAVAEAGAWGPALYIALAMASFTVFLLAPAVWVATALWSVPWAFAYSFLAALLASFLTYGLTFALGRDWARARVPARLEQWEARLEARPVWALVLIRFWFWANPLVDMLVAISRVPTPAYVSGTVLGLLWPTAFQVGLGAGGGALIASIEVPVWVWGIAVAGLVVTAGIVWTRRRTASDA